MANGKNIAAIITLQWTIWWKTKKQTGNKLTCIWVDSCSVNFTWDKSYSLGSDRLIYNWNYGNGKYSDLKNPLSITYWTWIYVITLKITDMNWYSDKSEFIVEVTGINKKEIVLKVKTMSYKLLKESSAKSDMEDYFIAAFKTVKRKKATKIAAADSDFDLVFWDIFSETNNELSFTKLFDSMADMTVNELDSINNYSIKLQWKLGKNLSIADNIIVCHWRKNCKINLSLSGAKIDWYKYVWNYPNWEQFIWINPKTATFNFGTYNIGLDIYDNNWALILSKNITIIASIIPTKAKTIKIKKPKISKIGSFSFTLKEYIKNDISFIYNKVSDSRLSLIFLTIFILITGLSILISRYSIGFTQL